MQSRFFEILLPCYFRLLDIFLKNIIRTLIIIMGNENKIHKLYIHYRLFINTFILLQIGYLSN